MLCTARGYKKGGLQPQQVTVKEKKLTTEKKRKENFWWHN